jgi:hypothetical protein
MANERLYQFPSKASPVPADIIFAGDSANAFDEVNITIAALIGAYPNLSGIAALTLGANTFAYSNGLAVLTAGSITALSIALLGDSTITQMQSTLGYQSAPAAILFAGWDANSNLSANNFIAGYATTVTAATTTTLTVASASQQFFTGSTTQIVVMPVTSTLVLGQSYLLINNSSGSVTVNSSGGNAIQVMAANTSLVLTCIAITGTTAASWYASYKLENALTLPLSIANGGTAVSSVTIAPAATAWAGWDANKNLSANNFLSGYTTTATAASSTTLTVASTYQQFFTGSTTQTVVMPVTSTLVLGQSYYIVNNSTGALTINSSGGNAIVTMAASTTAVLTCIAITGTTAASWFAEYEQSDLVLPISLVNGGTNAALTASNGGIVYSTGSAMAILAGTATSGQILTSGASTTPAWSTTTYPLTNAINTIMYASSANVLGVISPVNSAILISSSSGVPSMATALPFSLGFSPTTNGIIGTTTNDSTGAGNVGEYKSTIVLVGGAVSLTSGAQTNICTLSLTAGDWDVWGEGWYTGGGTTVVQLVEWGVNTSSGTLNLVPNDNTSYTEILGSFTIGVSGISIVHVAPCRISLASTTNVYLIAAITFTTSTCSAYGKLCARRRR